MLSQDDSPHTPSDDEIVCWLDNSYCAQYCVTAHTGHETGGVVSLGPTTMPTTVHVLCTQSYSTHYIQVQVLLTLRPTIPNIVHAAECRTQDALRVRV